ncbi:MAG: hypothetical protein ACRCTY_09245 [Candidatus Adiutrix sp.]
MQTILISDNIQQLATALASKRAVPVNQILEEALTLLQNQIESQTCDKITHEDDLNISLEIDKWMEIADAKQAAYLQSILDSGTPIVYLDESGTMVKKMPNGTIEIIDEAKR